MQEVVASFTTVMTWLVLLLSSIVVVLMGLAAWHLPAHRRALAGVLGMALVLMAGAVSLLLLAAHH